MGIILEIIVITYASGYYVEYNCLDEDEKIYTDSELQNFVNIYIYI